MGLGPTRSFRGLRWLQPFAQSRSTASFPVNLSRVNRFSGIDILAHHFAGTPGGCWAGCFGMPDLQCNLIASRGQRVGPAVSYAPGQGATMISAAWGVFVWREFRNATRRTHLLLITMFLFFCPRVATGCSRPYVALEQTGGALIGSLGKSIAVVGSLNVDLLAAVPRMPASGETLTGHSFAQHVGGKGANQAVAAARAGAAVRWLRVMELTVSSR